MSDCKSEWLKPGEYHYVSTSKEYIKWSEVLSTFLSPLKLVTKSVLAIPCDILTLSALKRPYLFQGCGSENLISDPQKRSDSDADSGKI